MLHPVRPEVKHLVCKLSSIRKIMELVNKKLHMPSLGLALSLLIALASPTSSCSEQEKTSLLQFLRGLSRDGGFAASWRNGTDCCNWEGISCRQGGTVTDVFLASKGLEGRISPSLGNLICLKNLNLSHNLLYGDLPQELLSSSSISVLDVSFNDLGGALPELLPSPPAQPIKVLNISSNLFIGQFPPTTWKAMENMITLNVSNNSFSGQIPTLFCNSSPSLAVLDLSFNKFSGSIPSEIGDCSMLTVLRAGHNNLSGTLPDELFNATSLQHLSLHNNELCGELDGAPLMSLRNLVTLDLGGNNFSGTILDSIGQLKKLEEIHLNNNNMSGELSPTLSNCTNLITIDFRVNRFSGELTKVDFSNLPSLKYLDLLYNNFSGTVPESIYSCTNLTALRLSNNNLHGQLSPRVSDLKYLTFLSLAVNSFKNITNTLWILKSCRNLSTLIIGENFKGELMPEDARLVGFENLKVLAIEGCSLSGNIPHWLSKIKNLEMLLLKDNQLTGQIPDWISNQNFLFYLDISNNNITGEIPTALMQMPMLRSEKSEANLDTIFFELPLQSAPKIQYRIPNAFQVVMDLSNNKLTGEIPQEIGQLKALLSVNFSFNYLTGKIPQSISNLTNLQRLDLSSNNLTGAIPAALNNLHFLSAFNVSNNDLEGPVPSGGQFNTFQDSNFDGNPKLCGSMLIHKCGPPKPPPATIESTNQSNYKIIFAITFGAFFGVGVLYDQLVLSRYFG